MDRPYDETLYVLEVRGDYRDALATVEGLADRSFGPEELETDEAIQDARWMNVRLWEEAVSDGDYTAHGVRIGLPAAAGVAVLNAAAGE